MTVVVWDGKTLATDGQANDGYMKWEAEKAWYVGTDYIVSGVGTLGSILKMRDCFKSHGDLSKLEIQPNSAELIVVSSKGLTVWSSNGTSVELSAPMAFGEGREYALGAMAMGAKASEAVQIANEYSLHCGKGVSCYTLQDSKVLGGSNGEPKEV